MKQQSKYVKSKVDWLRKKLILEMSLNYVQLKIFDLIQEIEKEIELINKIEEEIEKNNQQLCQMKLSEKKFVRSEKKTKIYNTKEEDFCKYAKWFSQMESPVDATLEIIRTICD